MPKFDGDWFHSRTGSQLSELAAIQLLVKSSNQTRFIGKHWGADRRKKENSWIYEFSATAKLGNESIQPSTMQTKIRNWIRLGFLKDKKVLPLEWSVLGLIWSDSVENGQGGDANLLYRLTIANALATVSFSNRSTRFDDILSENGLLLKKLINKMDHNNGYISKSSLMNLIDGDTDRKKSKNYSYWITDLLQSGLFVGDSTCGLILGMQFKNLLDNIRNYSPKGNISAQSIKDNPLALGTPFRDSLREEFQKYGSKKLIEAVNSISNLKIQITSNQTMPELHTTKQAERSMKWSKIVKTGYRYHCAVPGCDAEGTIFIQAAHIMPFSAEDPEMNNYHRNDPNNGIALCLTCHKMFDAGLFTFDEEGYIVPSKFIYSSELIQNDNQVNVQRILHNKSKPISLPSGVSFNVKYALYHRENIFLGE